MSGPSVEVASILRAAPRPQNWSKNEVRRWLEAIELDVYAPTFEAAGVQGADLIGMDADALKRRLGVAHLGHRTTLLKEIAILANRATLSMRRGEESRTKDFVQKRKELLDTMYPDRVRREMKAQQDEKLLEARAAFWTPDNRKTMGAVDHSSAIHHGTGRGARSAAPTRKHHEENLIISESDHRHRTQSWGGHAAQQRATVRPVTAVRKRVHGAGARPRTAGPSRGQDSEAPISGLQDRADGHGEDNDAELRRCKMPSELMQEVTERIKDLEAKGSYDELIKAWVEYGACVRMLYSDKDKLLVRTHFNMATTYLRQKLVKQAIYHFQEADMVNQANSTADDALSFKCRIMEGMGICETRLGHLKAAEALLEQARRLCLKRVLCKDGDEMSDEELSKKIEELDIEEIPDEDGAVASVLVAKSELFSAQAEYDRAVECLEQAYSLKEAQLGDKDKQIGKLFSALGTIRQKQMRQKEELLNDVQASLESAIRIRHEIQDKTEGIVLKGLEQEKGLQQLLRDIDNLHEQKAALQSQVRACKADVLDYMNRARKISAHNRGEDDEETKKISSLVAKLAETYAREVSDLLKEDEAQQAVSPSKTMAAEQAWLAKQGIDPEEFGLGGNNDDAKPPHSDHTEYIVSMLRAMPKAQQV